MQDPKTVLLLFALGKLVCTGAKSKEMVYESVAKVYEVLKDYDLLFLELGTQMTLYNSKTMDTPLVSIYPNILHSRFY